MLCQRAIAGPGLTAHALPAKLCCALVGAVLWLLLLISAAAVCWNQMLYSGVVSPAWQGAGGDNGTSPNPNAINLEFELDLSDGVGSTLELSWLLVLVIAGPALLLCWAVAFVALKASADRLRRRGPQEPRSPLGSHLRPHLGRTSAALWQARAGGVAARGGGREPPRPRAARLARAHRRHARMGGALLLRLLPARRGRQRAAAAGEFAAADAAMGLLAAHCGGGDRLTGGHGKKMRGVPWPRRGCTFLSRQRAPSVRHAVRGGESRLVSTVLFCRMSVCPFSTVCACDLGPWLSFVWWPSA